MPETSDLLEPNKVKTAGNAFLGVSLARRSSIGHPDSENLQTAFDLNEIADRSYEYVLKVSDDGWLIGGGEAGPYKLPAADTAHITLMDIGTFNEELGGIGLDAIVEAIESGDILIPQMEVLPTRVRMNYNTPPELEVLFDLEPTYPTAKVPLPTNWQLRFVANQLVDYFSFPSRAMPGRFHCSLVRTVNFRSYKARGDYFKKCNKALKGWREAGPQPLVGGDTWNYLNDGGYSDRSADSASGVWIYTNRQNRTRYIPPNFLPPYESDAEKMKLISAVLNEGRYISSLHVYVPQGLVIGAAVFLTAVAIILSRNHLKAYLFQGGKVKGPTTPKKAVVEMPSNISTTDTLSSPDSSLSDKDAFGYGVLT